MTRVEIWDGDLNDVEGRIFVDSSSTVVYRGSTSLPIEVYMTPGCDTEVFLDISVSTRANHGSEV